MQHNTWQQLLSLESRDIVSIWFKKIHGRELNTRRAKEITAAAKQAREFFRNSHTSDNSVKPLLTFYGVASLARALALLLRREGGEEGLSRGHGLETVDWSKQLSGELSSGLVALNDLKIRTCAGLFLDLAQHTKNRMSMHVRSGAVDWRFNYEVPEAGDEVLFGDLTARLPDLSREHKVLGVTPLYAGLNEMTYDPSSGVNIKVATQGFVAFKDSYTSDGYAVKESGQVSIMTADAARFNKHKPQFMHAYVNKMFGAIPSLFLVAAMPSGNRYSQLCMTYKVSFVLGMLSRYFPTHWVSLSQGDKGDSLWPTLNQAHRLVAESFPELVAEMIDDILSHPQQWHVQ
jgi:hypothetical protein